MSTQLLIAIQVAFAVVVAIVILLLIIRRQKQTIGKLKDILTTVKDEISGENLTGYLQIELDDTTAHCAQETVALRPLCGRLPGPVDGFGRLPPGPRASAGHAAL